MGSRRTRRSPGDGLFWILLAACGQAALLSVLWLLAGKGTGGAKAPLLAGLLLLPSTTLALGLLLRRRHAGVHEDWERGFEARVESRTAQLTAGHRTLLTGLAKLSEYRDSETGMHVERMSAYAGVLARELARLGAPIDSEWVHELELAACLHDIGKASIPDAILLKPGRLSAQEYRTMKGHAAAGEATLATLRDQLDEPGMLELAVEVAGGHHERWDGSGYPRGLAGEEIPLGARIVALADVFDALMSKRVYKPAVAFEEVERIIEEGRATHFDPALVDAFHATAEELLSIRRRFSDVDEPMSLAPHRGVVGANEDEVSASLERPAPPR